MERTYLKLTGSYNPILKPPYTHWRCNPGTMPFQSADIPSSRPMVATVPNKPLYLGKPTPSVPADFFWSCSLTLAVSKGMVQNCTISTDITMHYSMKHSTVKNFCVVQKHYKDKIPKEYKKTKKQNLKSHFSLRSNTSRSGAVKLLKLILAEQLA